MRKKTVLIQKKEQPLKRLVVVTLKSDCQLEGGGRDSRARGDSSRWRGRLAAAMTSIRSSRSASRWVISAGD